MSERDTGRPLIQIEGVQRVYGQGNQQVYAVRSVDLTIERGSLVALMGASGSGKTTLLNMMGGLDRPTQGRILYEGNDIHKLSAKALQQWRRREIGFVFQAFALIPSLTAVENVEVGLHIAGVAARHRRARATECLEMVGLGKRLHQGTTQLSGGEQQRVAIARAMAHEPHLILADEPTGGLDVNTGLTILRLFQQIVKEQGVTICLVTHDPKVSAFADVTHLLQDGTLVEELTA